MNSRHRIPHLLLIASLAVSLSLVGAYPQLLDSPATAADSPGTTTSSCCCGTADGECCGEACCGEVPPGGNSQPRPGAQPGYSLPDSLVAPFAACISEAPLRGRLLAWYATRGRNLPATHTLQADRVRIQT